MGMGSRSGSRSRFDFAMTRRREECSAGILPAFVPSATWFRGLRCRGLDILPEVGVGEAGEMGDIGRRHHDSIMLLRGQYEGLAGKNNIAIQRKIRSRWSPLPTRLSPEHRCLQHRFGSNGHVSQSNLQAVEMSNAVHMACTNQLASNFVIGDFWHQYADAACKQIRKPLLTSHAFRVATWISHEAKRS